MIHYHGTPVSGTRQDAARLLQGRHGLVSYYRQDDLPIVMDVCKTFVIDNGAFSHWRSGKGAIDSQAYLDFVLQVKDHPGFEWCLIPDKIDGSEQDNKDLATWWKDYTKHMRLNSVPVYHLHESLEYLEYLIAEFDRVALGSSGVWAQPGTQSWWQRMAEVMAVACDEHGRPKVKLHGLRMLDPEIFTRLPLASADSTNAAVNGNAVSRFGMYPAPTSGQRSQVIADRIESHNSAPLWVGTHQLSLLGGAQ